MKRIPKTSLHAAIVAALLTASPFVFAAVSADEASASAHDPAALRAILGA